jgi:serine/threonine protein kinase
MGLEQVKDGTGRLAILMSLVNGPNLHDFVFGRKHNVSSSPPSLLYIQLFIFNFQLDQDTKIYMALQLCQAIHFIHNNTPPIAHLDVKPSNVLVGLPDIQESWFSHTF